MAKADAFIFFCDDTREEVGNRISIMGLFGPKVQLSGGEGLLKSLVVGALVRVYSDAPVPARFSVEFQSSRNDVELPPSPGPIELILPVPGGADVWSTNIIGAFNAVPVHVGMRVVARLELLGQVHESTLEMAELAPDATPGNVASPAPVPQFEAS